MAKIGKLLNKTTFVSVYFEDIQTYMMMAIKYDKRVHLRLVVKKFDLCTYISDPFFSGDHFSKMP